MNYGSELKQLDPLDIVIFHVGGAGDYGPIESIINQFPRRTVVVCFEANISDNDLIVQNQYSTLGVRTVLVPKCVDDRQGRQSFYVNKYVASSSLFPPALQSLDEHVAYRHCHTWGENCEVDRVVEVDTVTIDEMVKKNMLPAPDVLSIDAQGAELRIMRGGEQCIDQSVLCVVSEVEFFEIYQGQDLFCAQLNFLSGRGFRLADVLSTQYWHPAPACGLGFLTVGEALFFRDSRQYCSKLQDSDSSDWLYKCVKLAAVAYAFQRFSYASMIVASAVERFGQRAKSLFLSDESFEPVLTLQQNMQLDYDKYLKNSRFFYKNRWHEKAAVREALRSLTRHQKGAVAEVRRSLLRYGKATVRQAVGSVVRHGRRRLRFGRRGLRL